MKQEFSSFDFIIGVLKKQEMTLEETDLRRKDMIVSGHESSGISEYCRSF